MDGADALLGGLGGGDKAPGLDAPLPPTMAPIKRDHDSTDDFEHLERAGHEAGEAAPSGPRSASQNFLDMEREEFHMPPRGPSGVDRLSDQMADKFTDSESDADTAGESPLHRAQPPAASAAPAVQPSPPEPALLNFGDTPAQTAKTPREVTPEPLVDLSAEPEPAAQSKPKDPSPPPKPREPSPPPKPKEPSPPTKPKEPSPPPKPKEEPPKPKPEPPKPKQEPKPVAHVIEAEVIFCQMGLDAWFDPKRLHPEVESLIYWRNPARSGAALGAGLVVLIALACCSVVSVLAYVALLALSAAVAFRVYKNVLQAVQKTNEGHPFKWLLEQDISVPADRAQSLAAAATAHLNAAIIELRRLFLVEDLVDSLKFGVLLWCLTYVGACFNGITLIILGWIALFTLPKAYEMNKAQVDSNLELARAKINEITAKVRAAVPLGRKVESEKDK